ncbi:hypothetical protein P5673_013998 [Acropora cervicornis]|uniref:Uncharacterized protein n=1 Tax=Acropora cervicornis TaxID=6130 RepID=A0AAD9V6H3_ACRCE|nr:hypothetical protein P5673_013998 [Acropora cervicornis]
MSSENPSVWCCSLITERRLNEAWGTLDGFSEGTQGPSAGSGGLATKVVPAILGPLRPNLLCPETLFSVLKCLQTRNVFYLKMGVLDKFVEPVDVDYRASNNSPSEYARTEIWSSGGACDGANGRECRSKRDSIVEMRSFVFAIWVCICCKVLRIESKDFPSDEGPVLFNLQYIVTNSVEERMLILQDQKRKLMSQAFGLKTQSLADRRRSRIGEIKHLIATDIRIKNVTLTVDASYKERRRRMRSVIVIKREEIN